MRDGKVIHGKSVLRYFAYGSGTRNMLAFHGYGQDHRAFLHYRAALHDYTLYVFDLFLFGQSTWEENAQALEPEHWHYVMRAFMRNEHIDAFELAGFSLGARMALQTYSCFPDQVRRIILVAPDGIMPDPLYRFATGSSLGRAFFRYTVRNPRVLRTALTFWKYVGWIGPWEHRYIARQLSTPALRQRIYRVWNLYRDMAPGRSALARPPDGVALPVLIFVGTRDRIIRRINVQPLLRSIPHARLIELEAQHGEMIWRSAQWLAAMED